MSDRLAVSLSPFRERGCFGYGACMRERVAFQQFAASFRPRHPDQEVRPVAGDFQSDVPGWRDLVERFGGMSFERGLYTLVAADEVDVWTGVAAAAFPGFAHRIRCFGRDWLGRMFAVDSERSDDGEPLVLMLEPGTGDVLEVPIGFAEFHEAELVDVPDAAVASSFFETWLESPVGREPEDHECIGYRVPLFLGGVDEVANLEPVDAEVYWSTCGQLLEQTRELPPGTVVRRATFVEEPTRAQELPPI